MLWECQISLWINWSVQIVLDSNLHDSYSAVTVQLSHNYKSSVLEFVNDEEKARPDRSSVSEVYIYPNNQNMIAIVALRPNAEHNSFLGECNWAHLNYLTEKRTLNRCQRFWMWASFSLGRYWNFAQTIRIISWREEQMRIPIGRYR
jgi:hypothetical protein